MPGHETVNIAWTGAGGGALYSWTLCDNVHKQTLDNSAVCWVFNP